MRVLIVGAGVVGLSTAWALTRAGHNPVLYDQGPIPNPDSASHDQHRIIRLAYGECDGYCVMVEQAFAAWDTLWAELGEKHYVASGTLLLRSAPGDWAEASRTSFDRLGVPYQILDVSALQQLCPFLRLHEDTWGVYNVKGGALLADRVLEALVSWLTARGVAIYASTRVRSVDLEHALVTLSDGTQIEGDALILATGAWTPQLLPELQSVIEPSRQVVVYVEPPVPYADAWLHAPVVVDFGGTDDSWAIPPVAGTGLKLGVGVYRRRGDPSSARLVEPNEPTQVLAYFEPHLRELHQYRITDSRVCYYGWSADTRFVVKTAERAAVVSGCSGHMFKFGALLGLKLAKLVSGAIDADSFTRWARGERVDSNGQMLR